MIVRATIAIRRSRAFTGRPSRNTVGGTVVTNRARYQAASPRFNHEDVPPGVSFSRPNRGVHPARSGRSDIAHAGWPGTRSPRRNGSRPLAPIHDPGGMAPADLFVMR